MNENKKSLELSKKPISIGKVVSDYSFVVIFAVILIAYLIIARNGISWIGITNILRHSAVVGTMALGMGIVIITRGIDLSVGSMLALVGVLAILVFNATGSILLMLLACVLGGAVFGMINGLLIGKAKLPPFIVTLATMLIFRSVAQYLCRAVLGTNYLTMDRELPGRDILFDFGNSDIITIPTIGILFVVVAVIMVVITTQTKFGKSIYAVGSNEKAAGLAGINTSWITVFMYLITGLLVGIAAFFWLSMNAAVDPATLGTSNEMYAIAAVVIGGISMSGGKGRVVGVIFGAMSYTIIDKIITSLGLDALINNSIKGAILLLAIAVQILAPVVKGKIDERNKKGQILLESKNPEKSN